MVGPSYGGREAVEGGGSPQARGALPRPHLGRGPPSAKPRRPRHAGEPGSEIRVAVLVADGECRCLRAPEQAEHACLELGRAERLADEVVGAMLKASGICAVSVGSAEEALQTLKTVPIDLVVLDWSLPGMSGLELCSKLRQEARFSGLPVLFLTAHSASDDLVTAFEAGADDFVSKPFRAPELKARVLGLLRRTQAPALAVGH